MTQISSPNKHFGQLLSEKSILSGDLLLEMFFRSKMRIHLSIVIFFQKIVSFVSRCSWSSLNISNQNGKSHYHQKNESKHFQIEFLIVFKIQKYLTALVMNGSGFYSKVAYSQTYNVRRTFTAYGDSWLSIMLFR